MDTWAGKADAIRAVQIPSTATLVPVREESVDWDNTQNAFIEGENLEVLKLLQKSYCGNVKMIYIDPPYNTGNEFILSRQLSRQCRQLPSSIGATLRGRPEAYIQYGDQRTLSLQLAEHDVPSFVSCSQLAAG